MSDRICDFGFAICDLASAATRRKARSRHNGSQLARLLPERIDSAFPQQTTIDNQFHPIGGFVSFFFHRSQLGDEFSFRTAATSCAVICADRCAASDQLIAESSPFSGFGKRSDKLEYAQGELLRSILQFGFIHNGGEVLNSSVNRQSQI